MNPLQKKVGLGILALAIIVGSLLGYRAYKKRIGITIPTIVAVFETTLQDSITSSQTTMTLVSGTDKAGTALASSTYGFVIDEGTSKEEFVTANCTSTACTSLKRGLDPVDGETETASLQKAHRKGASVKITNFPQLARLSRILNGNESLPNDLYYSESPTSPSSTALIDKAYADALAFAGFGTSTESNAGGGFLADQITMASSTFDSNAPEFLYSKYSTSTPFNHTGGTGNVIPVTNHLAYLAQDFLNLALAWNITGASVMSDVVVTSSTIPTLKSTSITLDNVAMDQLIDGTDVASTVHTHTHLGVFASSSKMQFAVANSTSENTLISFSVPANKLGSNGCVEAKIYFTSLDYAAQNHTLNIKVKYGGTTLLTSAINNDNAGANNGFIGYFETELCNNSATNSQYAHSTFFTTQDSDDPDGTDSSTVMEMERGTSTEDSTGALTFVVTGAFAQADAGTNIVWEDPVARYLPN